MNEWSNTGKMVGDTVMSPEINQRKATKVCRWKCLYSIFNLYAGKSF